MLEFEPVTTDQDLQDLADMAKSIWTEYWPPIIGREQTDYMVNMFHSVSRMKLDMETMGYRYWFLRNEEGIRVGYTGGAAEIMTGDPEADARILHSKVVQDKWQKRFFISKIYLFPDARGKHYGSQVLSFYQQLCEEENLDAMYLTVNINNELGIRAYLGNGFQIVDKQAAEIGSGYIMDDYIMAKDLTGSCDEQSED